jgi:TFIIF-interacting CTD phosphatase-like protein
MIIIDNVKDNFQLQPDNGLHIKDFYDDVNDTELIEILPYLIGMETLKKILLKKTVMILGKN